MLELYLGNNLPILKSFKDNSYHLGYIDPPFNTGKTQKGDKGSYTDAYDDFTNWIKPRLIEAHRILKPNGSFFLHIDYREVHYVKILLDNIFGRDNFMNEIIWAYDFGARQKKKWSTKHDNILWYVKNKKDYIFNDDEVDLIPKMAPGLPVSKNRKNPDKKKLTDVWWNTIVPTNGKERLGYPTQKPMKIIERIVRVHSNPGDNLIDFFCGSGTFGDAALKHGRNVTLIDQNKDAIKIAKDRLRKYGKFNFYEKI